jgi:hypothetical protein
MGHIDAIESVAFRHEEGNEGKKNGVERGIGGLSGGKLLKRKGHVSTFPRPQSAARPELA